ncbi:MAG: hypothetical protein WDO74_20885 [Pseudomonadota bacterium]
MFSSNPLAGRAPGIRETQGGGAPPPGGYGPPGAPPPGGYGPPGGYRPPGGYGPPGAPPPPGGYGPPGAPPPGGYGPPGGGGYGPPAPPGKPITGSAATMAMHAMTIDPKTGLPRGEKAPASTAAVVALVCGILICLGPFTGIPAIIAGVLGRKAAREFPQTVGGQRHGDGGHGARHRQCRAVSVRDSAGHLALPGA